MPRWATAAIKLYLLWPLLLLTLTRVPRPPQVFFMPARVMRGTPVPNQEEGLVDYAWCTREEVQEKVANEAYFASVQAALSH